MNNLTDMKSEDISLVTKEIIKRILLLENNTKKAMMIGQKDVLKGISIFKKKLLEINPEYMNDDVVLYIEKNVDSYIIDRDNFAQSINHYVHYGIDLCYSVLSFYNMKNKERTDYVRKKQMKNDN